MRYTWNGNRGRWLTVASSIAWMLGCLVALGCRCPHHLSCGAAACAASAQPTVAARSERPAPTGAEAAVHDVQLRVEAVDGDLVQATKALGTQGDLTGAEARKTLADLHAKHPYVSAWRIAGPAGAVLASEPASQAAGKRGTSGADQAMPLAELASPILGADGQTLGSVAAVLRPADFFGATLEPQLEALGAEALVLGLDGRVLYSANAAWVGRNLVSDSATSAHPETRDSVRNIGLTYAGRLAQPRPFPARNAEGLASRHYQWWTVGVASRNMEWRVGALRPAAEPKTGR